MTTSRLTPPSELDLPAGRLEARARHLVAEMATVERRRPSVFSLVLVPVAVVGAVLALLLVAPWQSRGPSVVDRALAAVGAGPVVHAVVEYSWPQDVVVELASGVERERVHRAEYWFDEQGGKLRASYSTDGSEPIEYAESGVMLQLDPALGGFVTQYRDALANGHAQVVGDATVDGRPAKRIEFSPGSGGAVEEVTVDAKTYAPLSFHSTYPPRRRSPEWRVLTIESIPRKAADFSVATPSQPRADTGEVSAAHVVSLATAERALGARPLWLGASFGGRALDSVELSQTTAFLSDGTKRQGVVVRLVYGSVRVSLGRDEAGKYAVGYGNDESPTPPEGSVAVTGNASESWQGELRRGDFAVLISAPHRESVIAAARTLG